MGNRYSNNTEESKTSSSRVITFHSSAKWESYFESSKDASKLLVIDFTASWCGPCRYMEPIFNEFATTYTNVVFVRIDVDKLKEVAHKYGVEAMPTFILMKKGKEVDKVIGAKKDELQKKIEMHTS